MTKGTNITTSISYSETIANKNGIILKKVTVITEIHYELFMDGEIVNKYSNEKIARAMFKDFSA